MALSLIGVASASGSSATPTVTAPAGGESGDRLTVVINFNNPPKTVADNNGSTPTTEQGEFPGGDGSGGFAVYYRILGGSEPASYAYTLSGSDRWSIIAWINRGQAADPFDNDPGFGLQDNSTSPDCPGATTAVDGDWAFAVAGTDGVGNGVFLGGPAGWTELATVALQQPMAIYYKEITPTGATGDQTFETSIAGNNYTLDIFTIPPASFGGALLRHPGMNARMVELAGGLV